MGWFSSKNNNTTVGTTPAPTITHITAPPINATVTPGTSVNTLGTIHISAPGVNGSNFPTYQSNHPNTVTAIASPGSTYTVGTGIGQFSISKPSSIISFNGTTNMEIVRLNVDGSVTWNQEINVDEAAEAFAHSLNLGAELAAGITKKVKANMRDTVFEEIIALAKVKGTLTLDDLTFMYEASKIMEKLKGGRE